MTYWIFKTTEQKLYPDVLGEKYVYDNTHSVRVQKGDYFLYLDKTKNYSFTASGIVKKITERNPTNSEANRSPKVRTVFTAHLSDVNWFTPPLTISPTTKAGRANRGKLGLPKDINMLGWSQSMPQLNEEMFTVIIDHIGVNISFNDSDGGAEDFSIPDSWSKTRARRRLKGFNETVSKRSGGHCIVCGSNLQAVIDAAHLSPYASDEKNRANPANGICLCKYCHTCLDKSLISILPNGELLVSPSVSDSISQFHFRRITREERLAWLAGVNPDFLLLTKESYEQNEAQQGGAANG